MTKKRSKSLFILFTILTAILVVLSFVSFPILFKVGGVFYNYNSFISRINYAFDINGGTVLQYDCTLPEGESESKYEDYRDEVVSTFESILDSMRYYDSVVTKVGDSSVKVEVSSPKDARIVNSIVSFLENPEIMQFKSEQSDTAEPFLTGRDVSKVEVSNKTQYGIYGVVIHFDEEAKNILKTKTTNVTEIYIYLGGSSIKYSIDSALSEGTLGLYSESFVSKESALNLHAQVLLGTLKLDCITTYSGVASAGFGFNVSTLIIVMFAVIAALAFVWLYLKYKDLGLIAILNLVIFASLSAIMLQSIPFMRINILGAVGAIFVFLVCFDAHLKTYEAVRGHYISGKKLNACYRLGQKSVLFQILTTQITLFVAGGIMALIPVASIKSFGMVVFALSPVSLLCSTVLLKLFFKMYEPLNHSQPKKINLSDVEVKQDA